MTSALERWFYQYGIPSCLRSDGGPQFRLEFSRWCQELGIRHEKSSSYNPESNGLSERAVGVIKETMKKTGAVSGAKLERVMFELNAMSWADKSGAPIDLFLARSMNSFLPNAGNKVISIKKEVERRRCQQERWMKRLGRVSSTEFKPGDLVRLQNAKTGEWDVTGEVEQVISHDGGSKTYTVMGEQGGSVLT